MTLALTATCVGGRRVGPSVPMAASFAPKKADAYAAAETQAGKAFRLTKREAQVVDAVIRTGVCVVAANVLGLSVKTIECHMANARTKAGVDTNYQLIAAYVTAQLKGQ